MKELQTEEKTPEKIEETMEEQYYKRIRATFFKRTKEIKEYGYSISISSLNDYLEKYYQIYCDEKTLRKLFKKECKETIRPHLIVAMCNILGLDLYSVIQYPQCIDKDYGKEIELKDVFKRTKVSTDEPIMFSSDEEAVSYLTNEYYQGKFHCYYFMPEVITNSKSAGNYQPKVNDIRHAVLEIRRESGETRAYLTEQNTVSGNAFTFSGRVIRLENINKIYMFLTAQKNNGFIWLLFDDVVLKKRGLYYKEIAMMTHSLSSQSSPFFEKMVLMKQELNLDDKLTDQIIRGILTFDSETVYIPVDRVESILKEYEELSMIFDTKESYYKISQYDIIKSNRLSWDFNKRVEVFLKIMSQSSSRTQAVVAQEQDIHKYFFKFQGL